MSQKMSKLREAGFDVEGALGRLMNNEGFYERLLKKFLDDVTFDKLVTSVEAGETKAAGEMAHALKGMCATLGMTELSEHCATLQNIYMEREVGDPAPVYAKAKEAFAQCKAAVEEALNA